MHSENKIALLLDSRNSGGIETHVFELALALRAVHQEVVIVLWQDHGQHPLNQRALDADVSMVKLQGSFTSLLKFLRQNKIDVLHTHGYKANILGRLASRLVGCRCISTFHNGDVGTGKLRFYTWLDEFSAFLSRNIAVNAQIAERVGLRTRVIANFVRMPIRQKNAGPRTHVAFVGRLEAEKAPTLFAELTTHFPSQRFAVFGIGSLLPDMQAITGSNTLYLGQVRTMETYWSGIDVLVISSLTEGLPMVALEAMSHGVPVIATRVGALPALIEHETNGLLANTSVTSLIDALSQWQSLSGPEQDAMRENAAATIAQRYAAPAVIKDILAIYT